MYRKYSAYVENLYYYNIIPEIWNPIKKFIYDDVYVDMYNGSAAFVTVPMHWITCGKGNTYRSIDKARQGRYIYSFRQRRARPFSYIFVHAAHIHEDLCSLDEMVEITDDWFNWAMFVTTTDREPIFRMTRERDSIKNFSAVNIINGVEYFTSNQSQVREVLEDQEFDRKHMKILRLRLLNLPYKL